jgi:putrescine transport system ATP-binding protein
MPVSVALRPEKIRISRKPPVQQEAMPPAPLNQLRGRVKDMVYFGSDTLYHLELASGAILKVTQSNTERHPDDTLSWGDEAYAWWLPSAHVVLTQ